MVIIQLIINKTHRNKYHERKAEKRGTFVEHFQTTIQLSIRPKRLLMAILAFCKYRAVNFFEIKNICKIIFK